MTPFRVFIGYDSREVAAYHVLCHSILARASRPVSITPIKRDQLGGLYTRQRGPTEATEFSLTRFLTPALCDYEGWALFMDCDMLVRCDLTDLALDITMGDDKAVLVCQHDYVPKAARKMDGAIQTAYPRKNWSSFMLFNNERCRALTPEYINAAPALDLHRFAWLRDEEVGALPLAWNHLVGEYPENPDARVLHYTLGGPWFDETRNCPQAEVWLDEWRAMQGQRVTAC